MHSRKIIEKVKEDYNRIAAGFSISRTCDWPEFDEFLRFYKKDFTILDMGCGNGRLVNYLEKIGFTKYIGIDQSKELLKFAKESVGTRRGVLFLEADISNLSDSFLKANAGKFGAIFAIASFHHLPPPLQEQTLRDWHKLLRPGGYLFMMNWNLFQWRFWKQWLRAIFWPRYGFFGLQIPWKGDPKKVVNRYYYAFTARRLRQLCSSTGFSVELCKKTSNIVIVARRK